MASSTASANGAKGGRKSFASMSIKSVATQKKLLDLQAQEEIESLEAKTNDDILKKQDEIHELEGGIQELELLLKSFEDRTLASLTKEEGKEANDLTVRLNIAKMKIASAEERIKLMTATLVDKKQRILRKYDIAKQKVDVQAEIDDFELPDVPKSIQTEEKWTTEEKVTNWQETLSADVKPTVNVNTVEDDIKKIWDDATSNVKPKPELSFYEKYGYNPGETFRQPSSLTNAGGFDTNLFPQSSTLQLSQLGRPFFGTASSVPQRQTSMLGTKMTSHQLPPPRLGNFQEGPKPLTDGHTSYPPNPGNQNDDINVKLVQLMENQVNIVAQLASGNRKDMIIRSNVDKDLPSFNGNPSHFNNFKAAFHRSTTKHHFDDDENMIRLDKALKGEAKKRVSHLMANPSNLAKLMKTLEDTYGRPEFVLDYLVEKAKSCDKVEVNKPESLVKFGDIIESLVTNIASYNKTDYLHNKHLVKELVKKLSGSLRDKWYEYRATDDNIEENLEFFSRWMERRVKAARLQISPSTKMIEDDSESRRPKRGSATVQVASSSSDNFKQKSCVGCKRSGHILVNCWHFKKKPVQERWNIVKDDKLCYKCLAPGHRTTSCTSTLECGVKECKKPHHSLLHSNPRNGSKSTTPQNSTDDEETEREFVDKKKVKSKRKKRSVPAAAEENLDVEDVEAATMGASVIKGNDGALPIVAVKLRGPTGIIKTFAMLDNGASRSLIENDLATELGVDGENVNISFRGFGGHLTKEKAAKSVNLDIRGNFKGSKYFQLERVVTVEKIGVSPYSLDLDEAKKKWPCLRRIKGKSLVDVVPRIIIGCNHRHLSVPREVLCSTLDGPVATRTLLGWVIEGDLQGGEKNGGMYYTYAVNEELDRTLHNIIKDSFKIDDFGIKPTPSRHSIEDKRALQIMECTTIQKNGRWETGLLWRDENVQLPESFQDAVIRLTSTEKRMQRDPEFKLAYQQKINEYLTKGYIRKVQDAEIRRENMKIFYIPHFGVTNPNKPGKFRLVFDAAAKCHGSSLNDHLLTGPDLLRPLPTVLWNFRLYRYVISGDIEDMFHRVKIRNDDKPSQRFLWRDGDSSRQPDVYEMQVMIFGATSSPASAIYVKDKNAEQFKLEYPEAYKAIKEDFYMDDCLSGGNEEDDVVKLREDITFINEMGGFNIKKWISNSQHIMETIPDDLKLAGVRKIGETTTSLESTERVLGLWWDPHDDYFTFKANFHRVEPEILEGRRPTKREVCRLVMSLFDPLGFIGHYRIKGMIVLQNVWRFGIGWDDEVPDEVYDLWKIWLLDLQYIERVRIPRCYDWNLHCAERVELHTFTDASKEAYAAVSYLRVICNDNIVVSLVSSKVKVAPLKSLTIPRLELQAAVLGAKLATTLESELRTGIHAKYFWSDSRTVLSWIKSESARLKEFVGNRVGAIHELTNSSEWRWVSTSSNVADEATRLNSKTDFTPEFRWFKGPEFLHEKEEIWPSDNRHADLTLDDEIISDAFEVGSSIDKQKAGNDMCIPNVERFSSFHRLLRAIAAVRVAAIFWLSKTKHYVQLRKLKNERNKKNKKKKDREIRKLISNFNRTQPPWRRMDESDKVDHTRSPITPDDLEKAEKYLLVFVQRDSCIGNWSLVKRDKSLKQLCPYIDEDGLVRARGRIDNSGIPVSSRRPIILPPKHQVTNLIVDQAHRRNAHTGQETVFNLLRQKYWITHGRQAVRSCIARCAYCRLQRAKPIIPEMGILPSCRFTTGHHPFTYTGIDYFGPIEVTVGRRHEKRWGVLLCCMVTRAMHIEIAHGLSSDETLLALSRFVDCRRRPHTIFSDNGTNFHGATKELIESIGSGSYRKIMEGMGLNEIRWSFIPPAAAHMGGAWERLIQSVKKVLKNILHQKFPTDTVLLTAMKAAENIVNSRPITYVSSDINDGDALTPNHFLKGGVDFGPSIPSDIGAQNEYFRMKWKEAQLLANQFWKRWTSEFLPKLLHRAKWTDQVEPIEVGDLVLMVDEQLPRNCWVKAVVTGTRPAKDGQVRDVDVTIRSFSTKKKTTLRRPVTKLCPLGLRLGKSRVMTPNLGVGNVEDSR